MTNHPDDIHPWPTKRQRCRAAAARRRQRLPARRTKFFHKRTFKAGVWEGAPSREDPRRNKARCAPRLRPGSRNHLQAPRAGEGPVSLRHLLSHSGLGKEQRNGRHQGGHFSFSYSAPRGSSACSVPTRCSCTSNGLSTLALTDTLMLTLTDPHFATQNAPPVQPLAHESPCMLAHLDESVHPFIPAPRPVSPTSRRDAAVVLIKAFSS